MQALGQGDFASARKLLDDNSSFHGQIDKFQKPERIAEEAASHHRLRGSKKVGRGRKRAIPELAAKCANRQSCELPSRGNRRHGQAGLAAALNAGIALSPRTESSLSDPDSFKPISFGLSGQPSLATFLLGNAQAALRDIPASLSW